MEILHQKNQIYNNISVLIIRQEDEILFSFHLQLSRKLKPSFFDMVILVQVVEIIHLLFNPNIHYCYPLF
jgi:hypothetical protein